jgi:3-oxoacyl-[acyl-carrier protein] reductase
VSTISEVRLALVTGSTRGIGAAVARRLLDDGWTVGINGRSHDAVQDVVASLGPNSRAVSFDVADARASHTAIVDFSRSNGGKLHALVHCAGIMKDAPLGMLGAELVDEVLAVNVAGTIAVTQTAIRLMSRGDGGSIVLFTSVVGEDGAAGQVLYGASKAAVAGIVRSSAKEVAGKGIRINAVAPGLIDTELIAGLDSAARAALQERIPLARIGVPGDVSGVVASLLSDDFRYVTGEIIRIDGGLRL